MRSRRATLGRLIDFCLRLGGRVEWVLLPEFSCDVDPERVIRHFREFKDLVRAARGGGVSGMYFGRGDAYFFAHPEEGEAGFTVSYDTEEIPEERGERFQRELESEFYDFMRSRGLPPEFTFIPRVEYGGDYLDVEARVPTEYEEEFDRLPDIARAMLEFKSKLRGLMERFGVRVRAHSRFT